MTTHIAMYLSDVARSREALSFKIDPSSPFSQILLPPDMRETHWSIAHGSFPPRRHRPFFHRLSFRHQTINTRTASSRHPSVSRARAPTPPPPQSHISLSFPFSANLVVSQLTLASHTQTDRVLRVCMRSFAQKCEKIGGSLQLNTRLPPAFPRPDRHPSLGYSWFVVSTSRSLRPPNERARTLATHGMAGKRRPRPRSEGGGRREAIALVLFRPFLRRDASP